MPSLKVLQSNALLFYFALSQVLHGWAMQLHISFLLVKMHIPCPWGVLAIAMFRECWDLSAVASRLQPMLAGLCCTGSTLSQGRSQLGSLSMHLGRMVSHLCCAAVMSNPDQIKRCK